MKGGAGGAVGSLLGVARETVRNWFTNGCEANGKSPPPDARVKLTTPLPAAVWHALSRVLVDAVAGRSATFSGLMCHGHESFVGQPSQPGTSQPWAPKPRITFKAPGSPVDVRLAGGGVLSHPEG